MSKEEVKVSKAISGLFLSDLHFSEQPPVARSVEPNWMQTQENYVKQVRVLYRESHAPIFVAGDVFEKWNSSAYLISSVISWLKTLPVYAIPGNHDTPNHNHQDIHRSAYWTLVEAGAVRHIHACGTVELGNLLVTGFPFGFKASPADVALPLSHDLMLRVALVHDYIWTEKTGHPNASQDSRYAEWVKRLKGYDVAFFGDNHKHFMMLPKKGVCTIMNVGGFMRRHSDEVSNRPCVGILYSDGSMDRHYLDVSEDLFADVKDQTDMLSAGLDVDLTEYVKDMADLHSEKVVFAKVVERWLEKNKPEPGVRELMLKAIGSKK